MKTIALQSFRTTDVPRWLTRCMHSVQTWVASQNFAYEFIDDTFFDFSPAWVKQRCADNIYALTDICCLLRLRAKLELVMSALFGSMRMC